MPKNFLVLKLNLILWDRVVFPKPAVPKLEWQANFAIIHASHQRLLLVCKPTTLLSFLISTGVGRILISYFSKTAFWMRCQLPRKKSSQTHIRCSIFCISSKNIIHYHIFCCTGEATAIQTGEKNASDALPTPTPTSTTICHLSFNQSLILTNTLLSQTCLLLIVHENSILQQH